MGTVAPSANSARDGQCFSSNVVCVGAVVHQRSHNVRVQEKELERYRTGGEGFFSC